MISKKYKKRTKIIFVIPEINDLNYNVSKSGGVSVILRICELINTTLNINKAFIFPVYSKIVIKCKKNLLKWYVNKYGQFKKHNKEYLKFIDPSLLFSKKDVFIYPEVYDNFLNMKNAVIFNMYFSKKNCKNVIYYSETFFNLEKKLRKFNPCLRDISHKNILIKHFFIPSNINIILEKCKDKGYKRHNSLYITKKASSRDYIKLRENIKYIHPKKAELLEYSNLDDLIEKFNKFKYFYTYDPLTFLVPIASLCGCIPIIVPFGNFKDKTKIYIEKYMIYGSAYGNSDTEIKYAINTRNKVRKELKKYDSAYSKKMIYKFLKTISSTFY